MSELGAMLEEVVSRLLGDRVTRECVEAAERGEWQGDLWRALEDGGLTRPHLSEAAGGAGGSWLEAYVPTPLAITGFPSAIASSMIVPRPC